MQKHRVEHSAKADPGTRGGYWKACRSGGLAYANDTADSNSSWVVSIHESGISGWGFQSADCRRTSS
jgi:hypothetical protein